MAKVPLLGPAVLLAGAMATVAVAQEWPHVGGDAGATKHSSLDQIHKENVSRLEVAWTFDTGDWSDGTQHPSRSAFEATPLVIDGVLYIPSPFSRLFALDAETGEMKWGFDPEIDRAVPRNLYVNRGVSSWSDGKTRRIFLGDVEGRLWAIDAATGTPVPGFGDDGQIDMHAGMGFPEAQYGLTSPTAVCGDVVVSGSLVSAAAPSGPSGDVRGLDARTGEVLWRFHTVARPGEPGHGTWEGESWKDRGGTNAWSFLSVDEARDLVFLPLTSPPSTSTPAGSAGARSSGSSRSSRSAGSRRRAPRTSAALSPPPAASSSSPPPATAASGPSTPTPARSSGAPSSRPAGSPRRRPTGGRRPAASTW